jgi:hypothetical protein
MMTFRLSTTNSRLRARLSSDNALSNKPSTIAHYASEASIAERIIVVPSISRQKTYTNANLRDTYTLNPCRNGGTPGHHFDRA